MDEEVDGLLIISCPCGRKYQVDPCFEENVIRVRGNSEHIILVAKCPYCGQVEPEKSKETKAKEGLDMIRKTFIVTGSASGLGKSIYEHMLEKESMNPIGIDIADSHTTDIIMDVRKPEALLGLLTIGFCGYQEKKEEGATNWKDGSVRWEKRVYGLINCAGVNYIDNMEAIPLSEWHTVMDTNATAIWTMTRELLPLLTASKGVILNVISNASHIPMTHSIAYNASKAAAAIMTRQMARELTKSKGITVLGVNPNKLEGTKMSRYIEKTVLDLRGWTEEEAKRYQLNALPAGFETKAEWIAELIVWLLEKEHRHQYLTGCLLDLGA